MKFLKLLTIIFLAATAPVFCMEQPPRPEKTLLEKLPGDLQRHLLTFVVSTDTPREARTNIQNFVGVSRYFHTFINREDTLKLIITTIANASNWYDELTIASKYEKMSGMHTPAMQAWLMQRTREIPLEKELLIAAGNNNIGRVRELLNQAVNTNIYCVCTVRTSLVNAVLNTNAEMITALLEAGANPNLKTKYPLTTTALCIATEKNRKDLVELLLAAKADVNSTSYDGRTPLMKAAECGFTDIANILLAAGAKTDIRSRTYGTALDMARLKRNSEMEQLLLSHGAHEITGGK